MTDPREIFRSLPFPFENDQFPQGLGGVVQNTVLSGLEPAREVVHTEAGEWLVGDGVNDPNLPGACTVTHLAHAIERNGAIAELATMPPGFMARRTGPGSEWRTEPLEWLDD
ncbi:hypothetical protein [Demequina sp.]|uniref:hypothetical protein n=1 Tax=Demequina sp. TaxID=2050685 RepID=UPI003D0D46FC